MISIVLPILMFANFAALLALVFLAGKRPRWRVRAVIYGWGLSVIFAGIWGVLFPLLLRGILDPQTIQTAFPDGQFVMGMLGGGWIWPLIVVGIACNLERKKKGL